MAQIKVSTCWGATPASYPYRKHSEGSRRLVVLFPGRVYPLDAPLMWYSASAAFELGWDVLGVQYGYQANQVSMEQHSFMHLVEEILVPLETLASQYDQIVFVGKSIGTVVLDEVLCRVSFPVKEVVYFTPLSATIPCILQSTHALVVVGEQDPLFGPREVEQISGQPHVQLLMMPGADHGLETDEVLHSLDLLKEVIMVYRDFLGLVAHAVTV